MSIKSFSQAAENNKGPILELLKQYAKAESCVLEVGSGTGQHALYFGESLPEVSWQPSDLELNHQQIRAWINNACSQNILSPITLNVANRKDWPTITYDLVYTANTCHIMSWDEVLMMTEMVSLVLKGQGYFLCYGPFNVDGKFTSASNEAFNRYLKGKAPHMGLRDLKDMELACRLQHLELISLNDMPANNKLLVFERMAPRDGLEPPT